MKSQKKLALFDTLFSLLETLPEMTGAGPEELVHEFISVLGGYGHQHGLSMAMIFADARDFASVLEGVDTAEVLRTLEENDTTKVN